MTRQDLSPGAQATQSAHAAFNFCYQHGPLFREWHEDSQYLVLLAVPDEAALAAFQEEAKAANLPVVPTHEPDFGDALTAIAIAPSPTTQRLCSNLPLALREECRRYNREMGPLTHDAECSAHHCRVKNG